MWRSFFLAVGIFSIVLGVESLVIDQVIFASNRKIPAMVAGRSQTDNNSRQFGMFNQNPFQNAGYSGQSGANGLAGANKKSFKTKDWMPWSLLASGTIIVMYICSLPTASGRSSGDE